MTVRLKHKFEDWPLRPIVSDKIPTHWVFIDTETLIKTDPDIETHTFRLAWSCLWSRGSKTGKESYNWQFWDSPDKLNEYLHKTATAKGKLILLGHNIYFDLQVTGFFTFMAVKGWQLRFLYDSHGGFILKITINRNTIYALSTTNWFDSPLAVLGEIVGKPKLDIDFNLSSEAEVKTYCRRDVEILTLIIKYYLDFITSNRLGKFSLTKASQAFTAFRFRFMDTKIRLHRDDTVLSLERSAYFGGRCECFYVGHVTDPPFVCLDVNSMYPFVMTKYRYPTQLVDYWQDLRPEKINEYLTKFCVISHVEISTPDPVFAVRQGGKLIFPVGDFETYLCTEGLRYALNKGLVRHIKQLAIYRAGDIFSGYVRYFHSVREQYKRANNKIMDLLCKYMENSLYGKWGQLQPFEVRETYSGEHEYFREEILDLVTGQMITHSYLMNTHIIRYGSMEARNSFAAIAAHVTENARMVLWSIIASLPPGSVLYCDTDSIIIRKSDLDRLNYIVDPYQLGALKVQNTWDSLFIGGAKYYVTPDNRHIKGIPENSNEIAPGVFEFFYWPKMTYHLRYGIKVGYHRRKIRRVIDTNYDKGVVHPDGTVTPHNITQQVLPF